MNTYLKWFWSECDELNKDSSFAYRLAEKAWNYRQTEIDELKDAVDKITRCLSESEQSTNSQLINENLLLKTKLDNLQNHLTDQSQYIKNLEHKNKELQILSDASN